MIGSGRTARFIWLCVLASAVFYLAGSAAWFVGSAVSSAREAAHPLAFAATLPAGAIIAGLAWVLLHKIPRSVAARERLALRGCALVVGVNLAVALVKLTLNGGPSSSDLVLAGVAGSLALVTVVLIKTIPMAGLRS